MLRVAGPQSLFLIELFWSSTAGPSAELTGTVGPLGTCLKDDQGCDPDRHHITQLKPPTICPRPDATTVWHVSDYRHLWGNVRLPYQARVPLLNVTGLKLVYCFY